MTQPQKGVSILSNYPTDKPNKTGKVTKQEKPVWGNCKCFCHNEEHCKTPDCSCSMCYKNHLSKNKKTTQQAVEKTKEDKLKEKLRKIITHDKNCTTNPEGTECDCSAISKRQAILSLIDEEKKLAYEKGKEEAEDICAQEMAGIDL